MVTKSKVRIPNPTELSFSRLWGNWDTPELKGDQAAEHARNLAYYKLKRSGCYVRRFVLKDQTRQYWGMGDPCGETCNVYKLHVDASRDKIAALGVRDDFGNRNPKSHN